MPVSALIGATACVILRVAPARDVFAPFADPLMFLFIGSFILARAIFIHGLDRRLAQRAPGAAPRKDGHPNANRGRGQTTHRNGVAIRRHRLCRDGIRPVGFWRELAVS